MAFAECLEQVPADDWPTIPLLLCVAEPERPGRLDGLDELLLTEIEVVLEARFSPESGVIPRGRISAIRGLAEARRLIQEGGATQVVIAATDSLLTWPTLRAYQESERLLTTTNSNGFIPGEGAGAVLVSRPAGGAELRCLGVGFGTEPAHIDSGEPLRADGLASAIRAALADACCALHDLDYRITDLSGEQYYFKEAALALSRILRQRKEEFDIWHPAECIGEAGAAAGVAILAVAATACCKAYTPGPRILSHCADDSGRRSAAILSFEAA